MINLIQINHFENLRQLVERSPRKTDGLDNLSFFSLLQKLFEGKQW